MPLSVLLHFASILLPQSLPKAQGQLQRSDGQLLPCEGSRALFQPSPPMRFRASRRRITVSACVQSSYPEQQGSTASDRCPLAQDTQGAARQQNSINETWLGNQGFPAVSPELSATSPASHSSENMRDPFFFFFLPLYFAQLCKLFIMNSACFNNSDF